MRESKTIDITLMALSLLAGAIVVFHPIHNFDFFWHLAMGREMLDQGRIIEEEIYSHTAYGNAFSNHMFASEILFYLIYSKMGAFYLVLLKVAMACAMGFMAYRTARRAGADPLTASFSVVALFVVARERFPLRPLLFSLLFLSTIAFILWEFRRSRGRSSSIYTLPVIMVAWDFFHGGVYGLGFWGLFVAGETAKRLLSRLKGFSWLVPEDTLDRAALKKLWIVSAVTVIAMLMNPYGLLTYDTFFDFASQSSHGSIVYEFQTTGFTLEALPFWLMLSVTVVLFACNRRRLDVTSLLLAGGFAILAIRYHRAVGAFALVVSPVVATYLAVTLREMRQGFPARALRGAIAVALIACSVFILYYKFLSPEHKYSFGYRVLEKFHPVGSARFIRQNNLYGNMYNRDRFGGYLAYALYPEHKIFMFSHHITFRHLTQTIHDGSYLNEYGITYAVIGDETILDIYTGSGWVPVFWEPAAAILVKNIPENKEIIDRYRLRYYTPLTSYSSIRAKSRSPVDAPAMATELSRMLQYLEDEALSEILGDILLEHPNIQAWSILPDLKPALELNAGSSKLWTGYGLMLQTAGNPSEAMDAYEEAIGRDPGNPQARTRRAFLLYERGEYETALEEFKEAMALGKPESHAYFGAGLSALALGDRATARANFQNFVRLVPFGPWAEEARKHLRNLK